MIDRFMAARAKKVAPATVNKNLRVVRAALKWAKRRGYIADVPDFTGLFQREVVRLPKVVKREAFDAVLRAAATAPVTHRSNCWWQTFLRLARYSGARRGELLGLLWFDVDLPGAGMTIRISKGRRERRLPLDAPTVEVLRAWWAASGRPAPAAPVLPWPYPNPRSFKTDWDTIIGAAGLDGDRFTAKDLRSTAASELATRGIPTAVAQAWLGHSTIVTTAKYYTNPTDALVNAARSREASGASGSVLGATGMDSTAPQADEE